tara:strand:+ start:690 stop:1694 length:1005 start_codon:yes stop_codon:yes gene_type:complete
MSETPHDLFPVLRPLNSKSIEAGDGHSLYLETFGNPQGIPAIFLHGGPGSGCSSDQARLFNPDHYFTVLLDQRGSGRSTPKRSLTANTTQHLISDMEAVRKFLLIEKWVVVGGSWGSTLALAYAEQYPERVFGLVLRAIFLGTSEETEWAFGIGPRTFYPDLWEELIKLVPEAKKHDPIPVLGKRLENADPKIHIPASQIWGQFERTLSSLLTSSTSLPSSTTDIKALSHGNIPNTPFIEWHYIKNNWFLSSNQLYEGADRLRGIPGIMVQGRYDMLCPPKTAYKLAERWSDAELRIVPCSGHAATETKVKTALIKALEDMAQRVLRLRQRGKP